MSYYILLFYTSAIRSLSTSGLLSTLHRTIKPRSWGHQIVPQTKLYLVPLVPFIIRSRCLKILVENFKFRHLRKNSPIQFSTFPPISLVAFAAKVSNIEGLTFCEASKVSRECLLMLASTKIPLLSTNKTNFPQRLARNQNRIVGRQPQCRGNYRECVRYGNG